MEAPTAKAEAQAALAKIEMDTLDNPDAPSESPAHTITSLPIFFMRWRSPAMIHANHMYFIINMSMN
jgi:hypothetical protein